MGLGGLPAIASSQSVAPAGGRRGAARYRRPVTTEPLHHLALADDWAGAVLAGEYTRSTIGRSLAEEGFIHMSRGRQVRATADRFYRGRTDVVLLTVDPDRLGAAVVDEAVGDDRFPHLYGPMPVSAVIDVRPLACRHDGTLALPAGLEPEG